MTQQATAAGGGGGDWITALSALPVFVWPGAAFMMAIELASSGNADPTAPQQIAGMVWGLLHVAYPILWAGSSFGARWLRNRHRGSAATWLQVTPPLLSILTSVAWIAPVFQPN